MSDQPENHGGVSGEVRLILQTIRRRRMQASVFRSTSYVILVLILCSLGTGLYLFVFAGEITLRDAAATQERILDQVSEAVVRAQPVLEGVLQRTETLFTDIQLGIRLYEYTLAEMRDVAEEARSALLVDNVQIVRLLEAMIKREEAQAKALAQGGTILTDTFARVESKLSAVMASNSPTAEQTEALRVELTGLLGVAKTSIEEIRVVLREHGDEGDSLGRKVLQEILDNDLPNAAGEMARGFGDMGRLANMISVELDKQTATEDVREALVKITTAIEGYVSGMQGVTGVPAASLSTLGLRAGSVMILIFVIQILVSFYRYTIRVASAHEGIADTLEIAGASTGFDNIEFEKLAAVFSSSTIDFGKPTVDSTNAMITALQSLAKGKG